MPTDLPPLKNDVENGLEPDTSGGHTPRPNLDQDEKTPSSSPPPKRDGGSFRIATLSGIPIRLHWTFFILLAWVAWGGLNSGMQMGRASVLSIASVIALFTCVVLHEMGHALTARHYKIRTHDIVLYPIGGVASLETLPRPRQELWIALAGPAVNLIIAGLLFMGLRLAGTPLESLTFRNPQQNLFSALMWANVFLGLFNLIPAFPMDGGRVLRALLARIMDEVAATGLAARVGQGLAVLFGLYSVLNGNFVWLFIAVFVYQGAQQEASAFQTRELLGGHRVREAMLREFHTLSVGATLREAADRLLAGNQHDFPIVHGDEIVGMLSRSALLRGMANEGPDAYVAGVMLRDFVRVHPDEPLENILPTISETGAMLVMENGSTDANALIGMATQENLYEFVLLSQAQRSSH